MGVEVKYGGEGLIEAGNLKERSASYGVYSFLRFNT